MIQTPWLMLSDNIAGNSGLARIARDICVRAHADIPELRVGSLGVGGSISTSSRFPFYNAAIRQLDRMIPLDLPQVWADFAGTVGDGKQKDAPDAVPGMVRKGILFVCWNASWTLWLSKPDTLPAGHPVRSFLETKPFKKWLYCPVDGHCSDGTMGWQGADALTGFDRLLAYTKYGADVMEKTLIWWGGLSLEIPNLPHGLDRKVFYPRDRNIARQTLVSRLTNGAKSVLIEDNAVILSAVATNSFRKDWGLAFETSAELLRRGHNVLLWGHTDMVKPTPYGMGYWDIPSLVEQYGMKKRVLISTERVSDENMAWALSACDCSLGIGAGEGWGFPLSEALACGIPACHGAYAGGAEFTPKELQPLPVGYRIEPGWNLQRPVFNPKDWADAVENAITPTGKALRKLPEYIEWDNAWLGWRKWIMEGLAR